MSAVDMADDIEALRSYLSLDQITMMGHSDSGAIGLFYGERYPGKLSKLVVIDGVSYGHTAQDRQETENEQQIRGRLASDPRYKAAFEPFKPTAEGDVGMLQVMQHSLPLYFADPEKNLLVFARTLEGMTPSSFAAKTNMPANHAPQIDSTSRLSEIKAKTLIVVGKQDRICPVMVAEDLHKAIAGSELVELEGSGHFPWIEQPTALFAAISKFLAK